MGSKITVVDLNRGAGWIVDGFAYFMKAPLAWIGTIILLFIINIVMGLLPIIGSLIAQVLMSVFIAGMILGCHAQDNGGEFTVNHLFAGFSQHTAQLIVLGIYYTLGIIVIAIAMLAFAFLLPESQILLEKFESGNIESLQGVIQTLLLVLLLGCALYVPLLMAYWFAPALIVLDGVSPITAMQNSFKGCLLNILPFLLYGIVGLFLCILASIPFLLGFLVLIPSLIASNYVAYREIFQKPEKSLV